MAKSSKVAKAPKVGETQSVETKREKFERLGKARMSAALAKISLLGNLASPAYEFTADDVAKMQQALVARVNETMKRFVPRTAEDKKAANEFTF